MLKSVLRVTAYVLASVTLFLVTRTFFFEMFKIPTPSMQHTLMVGDFLVVDKTGFEPEIPFTHLHVPAFRHPKRGEVIVFKWPVDPSINFVKRIVAVAGDTVLMKDGTLLLNGHVVPEPYVSHLSPGTDPTYSAFNWQRNYLVRSAQASATYLPSRNNWGPLVVPADNYFVLGDNRDNSLDSRYWGFVPDSLVRGTPLFVYFSYAPDSSSHFSWLTHARWRRFGTIIR